MSAKQMRELKAREKCLVSLAVLLDGNEAVHILKQDKYKGEIYSKAAEELTTIELESRLQFVGTLYREALVEQSLEEVKDA